MRPQVVVFACAVLFGMNEGAARADADGGAAGGTVSGCVESVPKGGQRPILSESFPSRGTSGYASTLTVTVHHGKGESVLPRGLDLQAAGEAAKLLKQAGFVLPDQDGSAGAQLRAPAIDPAQPKSELATTILELPLVPLPEKPGRNVLTIPALPIAVARANGEIATVCTHAHTITIEDPIAETPDAQPKPNPPPVHQREEWTALRRAATWAGVGLLAGAALAYLVRRWMRRPKPVAPPPPPRPPWEIALERLDEVRHAGLLDVARFGEYFDRVSDAVRSYLGARFGFDGLESTTDEIVRALERSSLGHNLAPGQAPRIGLLPMRDVSEFLADCDLVKFANLTPSTEDCKKALEAGERIVRGTMPRGRAFAEDLGPMKDAADEDDHEPGGDA